MQKPRKIPAFALVGAALVILAICAQAPAAESPAKPMAAELAPMAERSLLTRIARAGPRLVAVGSRGHILLSDDGRQWRQVVAPVNGLLTSVSFVDERRGWAVGHDAAILHTADGGASWTLQQFKPELNQALLDVLFLDARHGFAVGAYGLFLETRDGGASWVQIEAPIVEEKLHFNALVRLGDGGLLVIGEEGMLALSDDQGATWQRLVSPYESSLFAALPTGEHGVLLGGLRGNLYRSDDPRAGQWTRIDLGTPQSVFGLASMPDGSIAIAGLNAMLMQLQPDGRLAKPTLAAADAQAGDAGVVNERELGAFSAVMAAPPGLITVGDAGIRYWQSGSTR